MKRAFSRRTSCTRKSCERPGTDRKFSYGSPKRVVPTKLAENYPASSKLPGFYQRIPEVLPTFLPQWHSACGKAVTETGWTHQYTGETGIERERSSTSLVSSGTSFERRGLEFDPGKGSKWIYDGPQSITLSAYGPGEFRGSQIPQGWFSLRQGPKTACGLGFPQFLRIFFLFPVTPMSQL